MADIGEPRRWKKLEPLPEKETPAAEPAPAPAPAQEPAPAEPVPA